MSILQITFTIKEYNPITFNFTNCYFQIYSDETKFEKCIFYPQNNSVMDKTELKNNLKYFVKAMTEGEIFGIASFIIPRKIFDKKLKIYNLNNIELTLSEAILNKYFQIPIIQKPEFKMSISLKININYVKKKLNFEKKIIKKKKVLIQNYKSNSALKIRINNKSNNSSLINNSNSSLKLNKSNNIMNSFTKFCYFSNYKKKIPLSHRQTKLNSFNYSDTQSDISVIDSILIDNDELNDDNYIELKTKLNFEKDDYPSDKEIKDRIKILSENLFNSIIEKNIIIKNYINNNIKLGKSYENYHKKLNDIIKKKNKLNLIKENNNFKNDNINLNDDYKTIYKKNIEKKKKEFEIINKIFKDNITYSFQTERVRNLLLKTIKSNLDLSIDLTELFSDEGITIFREICQKYGLISGKPDY